MGSREAPEAELLLPSFTEDVRALYRNARPINGARWLMLQVTSPQALEDAKTLIALRVQKKRG